MSVSGTQVMIAQALDAIGGNGSRYIECQRKTRYGKLPDAMAVACGITPKKQPPPFRWRIYVCPHCQGFHLTQVAPKAKQGKLSPVPQIVKATKTEIEVVRAQRDAGLKEIERLRSQVNQSGWLQSVVFGSEVML